MIVLFIVVSWTFSPSPRAPVRVRQGAPGRSARQRTTQVRSICYTCVGALTLFIDLFIYLFVLIHKSAPIEKRSFSFSPSAIESISVARSAFL